MLKNLMLCLSYAIPRAIKKAILFKNELDFTINKNYLIYVLIFFKKHSNFQLNVLNDITVIDNLKKTPRFIMIYQLLSTRYNNRLRLSIYLKVNEVYTASSIFKSADWLEREVWDMFGIFFLGHKDLRRILTDYMFSGHPLRKDFPLIGYLEIIYNESEKKLLLVPVTSCNM